MAGTANGPTGGQLAPMDTMSLKPPKNTWQDHQVTSCLVDNRKMRAIISIKRIQKCSRDPLKRTLLIAKATRCHCKSQRSMVREKPSHSKVSQNKKRRKRGWRQMSLRPFVKGRAVCQVYSPWVVVENRHRPNSACCEMSYGCNNQHELSMTELQMVVAGCGTCWCWTKECPSWHCICDPNSFCHW